MAVVVVHVIVTVRQYIGPACESSTAGEIAEKAEGTGKSNHGGTEGTEVSRGEVA